MTLCVITALIITLWDFIQILMLNLLAGYNSHEDEPINQDQSWGKKNSKSLLGLRFCVYRQAYINL